MADTRWPRFYVETDLDKILDWYDGAAATIDTATPDYDALDLSPAQIDTELAYDA